MSDLFKLILLLLLFPLLLQGQFYKENCISGNCRNGFGLNRVSTSKDPLRRSGSGSQAYYYYELGYFEKGKLNGKGTRFETFWTFGNFKIYDDKISKLMNENQILKPDSSWMNWYQAGNFENGLLEHDGLMIEWNVKDYFDAINGSYTLVKKTSSGNFHLGILHGNAYITTEQRPTYVFDTISNKYINQQIVPKKIYSGRFENGSCEDCTESILSLSGVWGETKGKNLSKKLKTGWVIKNYEDPSLKKNAYPGVFFKIMKPYKVLLIGGREVGERLSAETSKNHKLQLPNGVEYYGEIDKDGKPFGFGILNGPVYYYEGEVDNGVPQGTGLYQGKNSYASSIQIGGKFINGNLETGASYNSFGNKLVIGGKGNADQSGINLINGDVVNGTYTIYYYKFDAIFNDYIKFRDESGYAQDGKIKSNFVYAGLTDAEKLRQRTVINGSVKFSDLVVGDVIVLDGLASVIESISANAFDLLDQRRVSNSLCTNMIRLSSHKVNEFKRTCTQCNGNPIKKYMYTAPPQEVSYTYYKSETIISEYSIQTLRFPQTGTYTKKFEPVERTSYCNQCNTTGTEIIQRQIKE